MRISCSLEMEPPWFHLGTTGETQMWTLEDLTAVDAVIRAGNFSAAARRLGVTRSAVSKAVQRGGKLAADKGYSLSGERKL